MEQYWALYWWSPLVVECHLKKELFTTTLLDAPGQTDPHLPGPQCIWIFGRSLWETELKTLEKFR